MSDNTCQRRNGISALLLALLWQAIASSAQARELRYTPQFRASLLQVHQSSKTAELSSFANATVQNYRLGTSWTGRSIGLQREGEIFVDYSQGNSVEAKQLQLRESVRWSRPKFSFQLGFEGSGRLTDGNLNLSLNEQVDRNRSIGVLTSLDPANITRTGQQLYEEELQFTTNTQYRLSRMTDWNAGFSQRHQNRRNAFSAPSLSQDNRFRSYFLGVDHRLSPRTTWTTVVTHSQFQTEAELNPEDEVQAQRFAVEQNDRSWQLGLSHRWSRRWEAGLNYLHLVSRAEGISPSTVEGPGAFVNWQPSRRDRWSLQLSRLQLRIADQRSEGEFGSLQYQRSLGTESELLIRLEKSFDSAQASFDDVSNNQLQLTARRNRIIQSLVQLTRNWRKLGLMTDWNYLEFETPEANPAFTEHRANSRLEWLLTRDRSLISGLEFRKAQNYDPGFREDLNVAAIYSGYQHRFIPNLSRKLSGIFELGIRAESSAERITGTRIERLAASISAGVEF